MYKRLIIYLLATISSSAILPVFGAAPDAAQLFESAKKQDDAARFDVALALYLKADSAYVAEGLGDSGEYAQALHNTGRAYFNAGKMAEGREFTMKAAQLREKLYGKVSKEYITSLNNYALSYLLAQDLQNALKYQTQVVDLCRKMNPAHPDEGMYLINLGRIYHALGNDNEAIIYMEEALPKIEKFGTNYEYILNFLGEAYMEKGDNANVNRLLGLMEEHNRHELEKECDDPECHLERAEYFIASGNAAQAKDEFMTVFTMPLTDAQKVKACESYARLLTNQRDFAQAGDYYARGAEVSEKADGVNEYAVSLMRQAGLCYFVGKEYDKCISAHKSVVEATDKHGFSEKLKSSSLQGLGNAFSAKQDYATAANYFKLWIFHLKANKHEGESDYAKAYERLATAEKFNGDYEAALADYDTAIDLYGKLGMHDEQQQAIDGKTMCLAYARKDTGEANASQAAESQRNEKLRKILDDSLSSLEQSGQYLGKLSNAQTLATVAGCYAQLEDYENAVKYYELYVPAIRDALAEDFLLKSATERELTWQQELSNIVQMNGLILQVAENAELYARMSKLLYEGQLLSKGILLSSNVEFEKVLDRHGTKDMKAKFANIKGNLEQLDRMKKNRASMDKIMDLTRRTNVLQLELARESAQYDDFMNYLRITADDVLRACGDDKAAIEFVTLDTETFDDNDMVIAVILSKEYPSGIALPVAMTKDIKAMIADKNKFANESYGTAIWGNILQAVGNKNTVYFAPDGLLNNICIEYLPVNGKPVSEQIGISRLSSTREIARTHTPQPVMYASLFGNIDYMEDGTKASNKGKTRKFRASDGASFATLEETRREVDNICSILKKHTKDTYEYTGTKASKSEFLSQDLIDQLNILHIATHGKYIDEGKVNDANAMDNSILAFAGASLYNNYKANEGIVTAAEIADMYLHDCDLAVLSACESGLGKLGDDGVFGLQRGFKNAGVKTLLVSLNEVADASTADMMIAFYRNLFSDKDMTKREALSRASAEIRQKYPDDNTWASFILIDAFN